MTMQETAELRKAGGWTRDGRYHRRDGQTIFRLSDSYALIDDNAGYVDQFATLADAFRLADVMVEYMKQVAIEVRELGEAVSRSFRGLI